MYNVKLYLKLTVILKFLECIVDRYFKIEEIL